MTDTNLDEELREFDYSVFSKVKDSLWNKLLIKHRQDNLNRLQSLSNEIMSDDELDMVVAAGTSTTPNPLNPKS